MPSPVTLHDKVFTPFIGKDEIQQRIAALGQQISADYQHTRPILLGILNGAVIFASDLIRHLSIDAEMAFVRLSSYSGTESTGRVVTSIGLDKEYLKGRDVIIVEDIIDTGNTLNSFLPQLSACQPASLKIATFLFKPDCLKCDLSADYIGFSIPNDFVVGYGLDYDGLGRNLCDLYKLSQ